MFQNVSIQYCWSQLIDSVTEWFHSAWPACCHVVPLSGFTLVRTDIQHNDTKYHLNMTGETLFLFWFLLFTIWLALSLRYDLLFINANCHVSNFYQVYRFEGLTLVFQRSKERRLKSHRLYSKYIILSCPAPLLTFNVCQLATLERNTGGKNAPPGTVINQRSCRSEWRSPNNASFPLSRTHKWRTTSMSNKSKL